MISRNRVIAAWTPVTVLSRAFVMSVIITFLFEAAEPQMNCGAASGARERRREAADSAAPACTVRVAARVSAPHAGPPDRPPGRFRVPVGVGPVRRVGVLG